MKIESLDDIKIGDLLIEGTSPEYGEMFLIIDICLNPLLPFGVSGPAETQFPLTTFLVMALNSDYIGEVLRLDIYQYEISTGLIFRIN